MSPISVGDLQYMTSQTLAEKIKRKDPDLAIIDVRGNDYIGGHILGSINVPSYTHDYRMPELARTLRTKSVVVFHCALSQQRGPTAALAYLREREMQLDREDTRSSHQEVHVLRGGFSEWQASYGTDETLTEGYVADLWQDGY